MIPRLLRLALIGLFLLSPLFVRGLHPNDYEGGRSRDVGTVEERNGSAVAQLLGEFRASMADMMFLKTERYLDSGIGYMPHIELNSAQQTASKDPVEHHFDFEANLQEHQEVVRQGGVEKEAENVPTLVRTAANDFRGFIGDLEREVKPWRDPSLPHVHTTGTELLPWYRLITLSDPHNIRGYMIGSWWLKAVGKLEQTNEALRFIDEGIANNPRAFQLHLMRGHILRALSRDADAVKSYNSAAELAIKQRPREGPQPASAWTSYKEEDARAAARIAAFLTYDLGDHARAAELTARYNEALGGDAVLTRFAATIKALGD